MEVGSRDDETYEKILKFIKNNKLEHKSIEDIIVLCTLAGEI